MPFCNKRGMIASVNPDADIEREKLEILRALLAAMDQRHKVMDAVADSETAHQAVDRLAQLLAVSEAAAQEVLNMQVRRLTAAGRRDIEQRIVELQGRG